MGDGIVFWRRFLKIQEELDMKNFGRCLTMKKEFFKILHFIVQKFMFFQILRIQTIHRIIISIGTTTYKIQKSFQNTIKYKINSILNRQQFSSTIKTKAILKNLFRLKYLEKFKSTKIFL